MKGANHHRTDQRQARNYLDMYSRIFDKLYREPTDGFIGIRFNREHVGEKFTLAPEYGTTR